MRRSLTVPFIAWCLLSGLALLVEPEGQQQTTGRVFIGCRRPATLNMVDTGSGTTLASLPIVGDTDDIFYDEARQRIYVIGGLISGYEPRRSP